MNKNIYKRRYSDRASLSAAPPIDWAGWIAGNVTPKIDTNVTVTTDEKTTQTIYIAVGTLSAALLIAAIVGRR